MPIDFMILDIAEDSHTQLILGRPFLAITGCKIYVKEGKLTFDMGSIMKTLVFLRVVTLLLLLFLAMGVKWLILMSL